MTCYVIFGHFINIISVVVLRHQKIKTYIVFYKIKYFIGLPPDLQNYSEANIFAEIADKKKIKTETEIETRKRERN